MNCIKRIFLILFLYLYFIFTPKTAIAQTQNFDDFLNYLQNNVTTPFILDSDLSGAFPSANDINLKANKIIVGINDAAALPYSLIVSNSNKSLLANNYNLTFSTFTNLVFINNFSPQNFSQNSIITSKGLLTFQYSSATFIANSSYDGGGISGLNITFNKSTINFLNNFASNSGGGVYIGVNGIFASSASAISFSSNQAKSASAIYLSDNARLDFKFTSLSVTSNVSLGEAANSGAIVNNANSIISFSSSTAFFAYNYSVGGATNENVKETVLTNSGKMTAADTLIHFYNNLDVVIKQTQNAQMLFTRSSVIFSANISTGSIIANSSVLTFENSVVIASQNASGFIEGGLFNGGNYIFNASSVIFLQNKSVNPGSVFRGGAGSQLTFNNSLVFFTSNSRISDNNEAGIFGVSGGAVYAMDYTFRNSTVSIIANVNLKDSATPVDPAPYQWGGFSGRSSFLWENSLVTLSSNIAQGRGGAISVRVDGGPIIRNSVVNFIGNTSYERNTSRGGGAIEMDRENVVGGAILAIENSIVHFTSNTSYGSGGAVYGQMIVDESTLTFIGNVTLVGDWGTDGFSGGGAYMGAFETLKLENFNTLFVTKSYIDFINNMTTGGNGGGAIAALWETGFYFGDSNINFINNSAAANGGAISYFGNNTTNSIIFTVERSTILFNQNRAQNFGGAINSLKNARIIFTYSSLTFISNSAQFGGAIFSVGGNLEISNVGNMQFISNAASDSGGAIAASGNLAINLVSSSLTFINNSAQNFGGALYIIDDAAVQIQDGAEIYFINNTAGGIANDVYLAQRGNLFFNSNGFILGNIWLEGNSHDWSVLGGVVGISKTINIENAIAVFSDLGQFWTSVAVNINNSSFNFINSAGDQPIQMYDETAAFNINNSTLNFMFNETYRYDDSDSAGLIYVGYNIANIDFINAKNSSITFSNNSVNSLALDGYATLKSQDSIITFAGNWARGAGGAVSIGSLDSDGMRFIIETNGNSIILFTGNTSQKTVYDLLGNGGAIYLGDYAGGLSIFALGQNDKILFENNTDISGLNDIYWYGIQSNPSQSIDLITQQNAQIIFRSGWNISHVNISYEGTDDSILILQGNIIIGSNFSISKVQASANYALVNIGASDAQSYFEMGGSKILSVDNSSVIFRNVGTQTKRSRFGDSAVYLTNSAYVLFDNTLFDFYENYTNYSTIYLTNSSQLLFNLGSVRFYQNRYNPASYAADNSTLTFQKTNVEFYDNETALQIDNNAFAVFDISVSTVKFTSNSKNLIANGIMQINGKDANGYFYMSDNGGGGSIIGSGKIIKDASGIFDLLADASAFTGTFIQTDGLTRINAIKNSPHVGIIFGGENIIDNSELIVVARYPTYKVAVGENARFTHYSIALGGPENNRIIIDETKFKFTGNNSTITFTKNTLTDPEGMGANDAYVMNLLRNPFVDEGKNNTLEFRGENLRFGDSFDARNNATIFKFSESLIRLQKNNWTNGNPVATDDHGIIYLSTVMALNTKLSMVLEIFAQEDGQLTNVDFVSLSGDSYLIAQSLPSQRGIGLNDVFPVFHGDTEWISDEITTYTWLENVLMGQLKFDLEYSSYTTIVADTLLYTIAVATWTQSGGADDTAQSLVMGLRRIFDEYSLNGQNIKPNARSFRAPLDNIYVPAYSLDITAVGIPFTVYGGLTKEDSKHYFISGQGEKSFFNLEFETELRIQGITMTSASIQGSGGALIRIVNDAALTIVRSAVVQYSAAFYNGGNAANGGAVYISKGNLLITESSDFIENFAQGAIDGSGGGGAIAAISDDSAADKIRVQIGTSTLMQSNKTDANGGAVFASGGHTNVEILAGSIFADNIAGGLGGAIFANNGSTITINSISGRIEFINNIMGGGAIENDIYLDGSVKSPMLFLIANVNPIILRGGLQSDGGDIAAQGLGGIYLSGINKIGASGGGDNPASFDLLNGRLYLDNALLEIAKGSIFIIGDKQNASHENNARLELSNSVMTIDGDQAEILFFSNDFANSPSISILTLNNSSFISYDDIMFDSNITYDAPIVSVLGESSIVFAGSKTNFSSNTVLNSGSSLIFIDLQNAVLDFTSTTFMAVGNIIKSNKGGIFHFEQGLRSIIKFGGAVIIATNTVGKNQDLGMGAALYLNNTSLEFSYIDQQQTLRIPNGFYANQAGLAGGAIFAEENTIIKFLHNTEFSQNVSQNGGAVYIENSQIYFSSPTIFDSNIASKSGGALYIGSGANVEILGGAIFRNNRAMYGGSIYNAGTLTLKTDEGMDIIFTDNLAVSGLDIYSNGILNLNLNFIAADDESPLIISADFGPNSVINKNGPRAVEITKSRFVSGIINISSGRLTFINYFPLEFKNVFIAAQKFGIFEISNSVDGGSVTFNQADINAKINFIDTDLSGIYYIAGDVNFNKGFISQSAKQEIVKNTQGTWNVGGVSQFAGAIAVSAGSLNLLAQTQLSSTTIKNSALLNVEAAADFTTLNILSGSTFSINSEGVQVKNLIMDDKSTLDFNAQKAEIYSLNLVDNSTISGRIILNVDTKNSIASETILQTTTPNADVYLNIDKADLDLTALKKAYSHGYITESDIVIAKATAAVENADAQIVGRYVQNQGEIARYGRIWRYEIVYDKNLDNQIVAARIKIVGQAVPIRFDDMSYNQAQIDDLIYRVLPYDTEEIDVLWDAAEDLANNDKENFNLYLEQISGSFLATLLTMPAIDIIPHALFGQIDNKDKKIWSTADIGYYKTDNKNIMGAFETTAPQGLIGADIIKIGNFKTGLFLGAIQQNIKQGSTNKGGIASFGGGVYGGAFGIFNGAINTKFQLGFTRDDINVWRHIDIGLDEIVNANFAAYTFKAQTEIEFRPDMVLAGLGLGFFTRINFANTQNAKFEEHFEQGENAALIVDAQEYNRLETDIGINLNKSFGKLDFGAKVYMGFIPIGRDEIYDMHLAAYPDGAARIETAKSPMTILGFNILGVYSITQNFAITINGGANFGLGQNTLNAQGGLGLRVGFGGAKPEEKVEPNNAAPAENPQAVVEEVLLEQVEVAVELEPQSQPPVEPEEEVINIPPLETRIVEGPNNIAYQKMPLPGVYTVVIAYFAFNEWTLTQESKARIADEARRIQRYNYTKLIIIGYTDSVGSDRVNDILSFKRADSVYREFVNNGIEPYKIEYWGRGKRNPAAPNNTPANRAKNRRATLTVK
ncbi:MAG: OmpA family protein [Elusimicrobiota bacterium]|jgi:predicted outer membrane repeat protein|nr:OmpA family protein [Elusimicrobiota bacterium]